MEEDHKNDDEVPEEKQEESATPAKKKSKVQELQEKAASGKMTKVYREIPFPIDGENYILKEPSTGQRDNFLTLMSGRGNVVNGKFILKNFKGMGADLLSACLFKEGSKAPVTPAEIARLPAPVSELIFEAACELGGINEDGAAALEDKAKND